MFLCGQGLVLRAKRNVGEKVVEAGAGDSASASGEFRACFMQACKNVPFFKDVSAAAEND